MKTWNPVAVILIVLLLPCVSFGQIYEWVDEKGVKHYSNEPPPEGIEVFSQSDELITDETQSQKQEESGQPESDEPAAESDEPAAQTTESEPASEQPASETTDASAPDTVVVEDEEREAFHRERIKQRTRQNTSPAPSLQERPKGEASGIKP